jgi:hypothetical protein
MQAGPKIFEVALLVIVPRKSRRVGVRWAAGIFERRGFVFWWELQQSNTRPVQNIFEVALLRYCACPTQKLRRAGRALGCKILVAALFRV